MTSKSPYSRALLSSAAALLAAPLAAQLPNDECANATVLRLGINPSINAVGATPSPVTWPGGTPQEDVWMRYRADYTGAVEVNVCRSGFSLLAEVFTGSCGSLQPLTTGFNFCGPYYGISSPTWNATAGTDYFIRVYKDPFVPSAASFQPVVICDPGVRIQGVADVAPGAGTLGGFGGEFNAMDRLRWNYSGQVGPFVGNFAATVINIGNGGSAPIGVTPLIPGYRQLWSGSTPSSSSGDIVFGPYAVGAGDESVLVPAGLFAIGDTVRIQGLIFDATATNSTLPVLPTLNTVEWVYGLSCQQSEGFEGLRPGFGSFPPGWNELIGPWVMTANANAAEGSQYLRCDTSIQSQNPMDFFLVTPVYPAAGLSTLEFLLGRLGPNVQTLTVLVGDGSGVPAQTLAAFDGAPNGELWSQERVALTNLGASVQFGFRYRSRGGNGDLGLDGFCLR